MSRKKENVIVRALSMAFAVLLFVSAFVGVRSFAQPPEIGENTVAILYHEESGTVLYEKDADKPVEAGPAARLLAGLIFAQRLTDPNEKVTVNRRVTGLAGSTMNPGLKSGETVTVYDLLCGMLIANSEDAVYALAFHLFENDSEAPEKMLAEMNEKAAELGMTHTRFVRIVGSDPASDDSPGNMTTARDLLILANAARKNDTVTEIVRKEKYIVPKTDKTDERLLLTRNYMLSALRVGGYTYKYATGMAAENSARVGYCVIASAAFEGKKFIAVVMNEEERFGAFSLAAKLFDFANKEFSYIKILDTTDIMGEIEVTLSGDSDYVTVAPEKSISAFLPNGINVKEEVDVQVEMSFSKLTAPVYEGLIAGKATVTYGNRELGQVNLVTTGSLALNNNNYYLFIFQNFLRSTEFLLICVFLAGAVILYVLINARVRYLRKNRPSSLEFSEKGNDLPPISADSPVRASGIEAGGLAEQKAPPEKESETEKEQTSEGSESLQEKESEEENGPEILSEYLAQQAAKSENPQKLSDEKLAEQAWEEKLKAETNVGENYPLHLTGAGKVYDIMADNEEKASENPPEAENALTEAGKNEKKRTDYTPEGWN